MKNWILLLCLAILVGSCDKENKECPSSTEQTFALTGFSRVNAGDAHHVTITKGTEFSIKASGCSNDLNDLELTIDANQSLEIKYKRYRKNRYRVDFSITMPTLTSVNLSGASKGFISGFAGQNSVIRTILSGASQCIMTGTGINASVEISGASQLTLSGNTESLYGNISGASQLNAYGVAATEVDISVSGSSKAYVNPLESFFASASGSSQIYYRGNPTTKHFETSGNGKIIHE